MCTRGRRVGLYRFCGDIGRGNFSRVKLAVHQLTRDKVAIKVVDRSRLDTRALRMLSSEVKTLECVHHPNILRLFEVVETLGRVHLVTEWIKGGELYLHLTSIQSRPLRERRASFLFKQVVLAVQHMHRLGFVHRDIKAENVLLFSGDRIKLADFGFSTQLLKGPNEHLDTFCGSPPYAAPELFSDDHYIGGPVDIWALGILLYFMVIGNMPFRASTVPALRAAVLRGDYTLVPYLSLPCIRLIQRILVHAPLLRPSLDEILDSQWVKYPQYIEEITAWDNVKPKRKWYQLKNTENSQLLSGAIDPFRQAVPIQCVTKRTDSILEKNYLQPLQIPLAKNSLSESVITVDKPTGTSRKKSLFGGKMKMKIEPLDNKTSIGMSINGKLSITSEQQINKMITNSTDIESLTESMNFDEEQGDFIMLPTNTTDLTSLHPLEVEARNILMTLGINGELLLSSIPNGPRSDIIGAYRIVIHRLQQHAYLQKLEQRYNSIVQPIPKTNKRCVIL